jgi:hypothetical protein
MKTVLILDTTVLCVLLQVPDKDTCDTYIGNWTITEGIEKLEAEAHQKGALLILPLAAIIETGNHISRKNDEKSVRTGQKLANLIKKSVNEISPWVIFTKQAEFWEAKALTKLADEWPAFIKRDISMGDATILAIRDYYLRSKIPVMVLTGDRKLRDYEEPPTVYAASTKENPKPRRRR